MIEIKKVLIEVGHPAQVHQFKYLYKELENKNIEVLIVAKSKEVSEYLLEAYGLNYKIIDKTKKGIVNKLLNLPVVYYRMYKIIKSFKPDIILSRFSFQSSHLAKILNIPHIGFSDTEHVNLSDKLTVPFVDVKITASSFLKDLGKNHFKYKGNIELFYLHPDRFQPNIEIKKDLGLDENERYAIIRFVSWDAHHDIGKKGFSEKIKYELIEKLSQHVRVFITSEIILPPEFEKYQIAIPPEKIHDAIAFADLYIGEGGTMASEAACLGTPSVYINELNMGYLEEEKECGLIYSFRNLQGVIEKAVEIVTDPKIKIEHKKRLKEFLYDKINVTSFIAWIVMNYPQSIEKLSNDKEYYKKFI